MRQLAKAPQKRFDGFKFNFLNKFWRASDALPYRSGRQLPPMSNADLRELDAPLFADAVVQ